MKPIHIVMVLTVAIAGAGAQKVYAHGDVGASVALECGGCHQLKSSPKDGIEERAARKGPPLYFAGDKFRKEWLVQWLQHPERIRPAGDFPPNHVKTTAKGDVVDSGSLVVHPKLDAESAEDYADWLMTLRAKAALIAKESYKPGHVSKRMGVLNFTKFKGCGACHQDEEGYGGLSGPELYTAWKRLKPEFILSYIRDPVAWEPGSLMPAKHLQTKQIGQIVDYLRLIGEEGKGQ